MATIYHVTTKQEWSTAQQQGFYTAPSLETEGFIHCSKAAQVEGVLQRYFSGKKDLVKLTIDTGKLTAPLQYDLSPSVSEEFPHVYGTISTDAVTAVEDIQSF